YGVDHGICLHEDPKLRTVLWGWAGEPLPEPAREKLAKLRVGLDGELGGLLADHLTAAELRAVAERTDELLAAGVFPTPTERMRAIPWPLF
ncbi:MAG: SCO1664 family protein, partial [Thermocrispum sp.]